jgi:RNA polymerase sigma-70 factor (ECF subfamily)
MAGDEQRTGGFGVAAPESDSFVAFYDATSTTAFSVAMRITQDRPAAETACEEAYLEAWRESGGRGDVGRLLELVRDHALAKRTASSGSAPAATNGGNTVTAALNNTDPLGRRAVELAYFGGLSVPEVASILESTAADVRRAMRTAMLSLAAATAGEAAR